LNEIDSCRRFIVRNFIAVQQSQWQSQVRHAAPSSGKTNSSKLEIMIHLSSAISSNDDKLRITNAVVKIEKATLTAEKMQIQLPIFGVRVEPDSTELNGSRDTLLQIPDAINEPPAS
jgi:hypothetical protein